MPRSHRLKMQRASEAQKPRSIVTDGLIVAGATAAAYLLTFAYEYGYCAYFGIPGFLIEPSTGTILFAAVFILGVGILFIDASFLPRELLAALPWPRLRTRLVLLILMWVTPALMDRPFDWLTVLLLCAWTLVILDNYVYALIFRSGSFAERILQGEKDTEISKSPWDGPNRVFGAKAVGLVMIAYLAIMGAWMIGTIHARFQEGFIVVKSTPDIAVIKRYGDRFVAIRYAGASPRATGEFRVIDREKDMEFMNLDKLTIESVRRRRDSDNKAKN